MAIHRPKLKGIYYNSADMPVFLEGHQVGGHDYVYVEGHLRIPGHFVEVADPRDDPDAPETFRIAYRRMMEAGESKSAGKETHANTNSRQHNVVPMDDESPKSSKSTKPRTSRKGKRESAPEGESSQ